MRVEDTYNGSWSAANYDANMNSLSYEVCQQLSASDAEFIENENMVLRQMAEDMTYYGDTPNYSNIKFHNEFSSTSCPARSLELHGGYNDSLRDYVIAKIKHYQSLGSTVQEMLGGDDVQEGWKKNATGWWHVNSDGSYPANSWQKIDDVWYYFDGNGYMKSNSWHKHTDGYWYYLLPSGAMATGWALIANKWYYFKEDGKMATGWVKYKDHWYYLDAKDGDMKSKQFIKSADGSGWYYLKPDGSMADKPEFTVEPDGLITTK
ncbi:Phage lysin, N-acetylmuramoyl-L-alanine amidase [Streptococcus oralis]|uniref:Phage lysin, N-acetylmuramoyl-L-alanine amidase n=1 Tax=Streptococcus oralis TaxID=1303 RepID=A0A139P1R6_STROR|nr:Phage lysin, N-acetylmuramoyl-L-alanine amidase [Streptococcus oralis]